MKPSRRRRRAFGGTWGGGGGASSSSCRAGKAPADVKPSFDSYAYGGKQEGAGVGRQGAGGGEVGAADEAVLQVGAAVAPVVGVVVDVVAAVGGVSSAAASSSSCAASSSARRKFENGDTVTVHGLKAAPQFNGKRGYVDGFNAESGRYTISLFEPVGDRCELLVKEINLSK